MSLYTAPEYEDPEGWFTIWSDTSSSGDPDAREMMDEWFRENPGALPEEAPRLREDLEDWYRGRELDARLEQLSGRLRELDARGTLIRLDVSQETAAHAFEAEPLAVADLRSFLFDPDGAGELPVALYERGGQLQCMRWGKEGGDVESTLRILPYGLIDARRLPAAASSAGDREDFAALGHAFEAAFDPHMAQEVYGRVEEPNVIDVPFTRDGETERVRRYGLVRGGYADGAARVWAYPADSSLPDFNEPVIDLMAPDLDNGEVSFTLATSTPLGAELIRQGMIERDEFSAFFFTPEALSAMPTVDEHMVRTVPAPSARQSR